MENINFRILYPSLRITKSMESKQFLDSCFTPLLPTSQLPYPRKFFSLLLLLPSILPLPNNAERKQTNKGKYRSWISIFSFWNSQHSGPLGSPSGASMRKGTRLFGFYILLCGLLALRLYTCSCYGPRTVSMVGGNINTPYPATHVYYLFANNGNRYSTPGISYLAIEEVIQLLGVNLA